MKLDHRQIKTEINKNLKFRPDTDDDRIIIPDILGRNIFRLDHLKNFYSKEKQNIIDCGAHIGIFTMLASYYFPEHKIHAFEPNTESFNLLKINTKNRKNVVVIQKGVGYKNSVEKLYKPTALEHNGSWTLIPAGARYSIGESFVEVKIIDLYDYISKLKDPIFILKLDLEGFEAKIINKFPDVLLKKIKIILLEEHEIPINHKKLNDNNFIVAFNPSNSIRQFVYVNTYNNIEVIKECFDMFRTVTFENYREKYKILESELESSKKKYTQRIRQFLKLNL